MRRPRRLPKPAARRRGFHLWVSGLLLCVLASCGGEMTPPEQQLRQLVGEAEAAAEARKLLPLSGMIGGEYRDEQGRLRQDLVRLIAGYLLTHRSIHLLSHVEAVEFSAPGRARLVVYLGISANPIEPDQALSSLRLDLHRLELDLVAEDDEWLLVGAQWRRARGDDILRKLRG